MLHVSHIKDAIVDFIDEYVLMDIRVPFFSDLVRPHWKYWKLFFNRYFVQRKSAKIVKYLTWYIQKLKGPRMLNNCVPFKDKF